jgi:hypothetical protein
MTLQHPTSGRQSTAAERFKNAACRILSNVDLGNIPDPEPARIILVASSARSGTSVLAEWLKRNLNSLHLPGEMTPLLALAGMRGPLNEPSGDNLSAKDASGSAANLLRRLILSQAGVYKSRLQNKQEVENFAAYTLFRLALQWPQTNFDSEFVTEMTRKLLSGRFGVSYPIDFGAEKANYFFLELLATLRNNYPHINPYYYDVSEKLVESRFPRLPIPTGPPGEFVIEVPPFIVPRPWAKANETGERSQVLVLKSSSLAFQIPFYQKMFQSARTDVLHVLRRPEAAINGLMDGWLYRGFYTGQTDIALSIKGYTDRSRAWSAWWWKHDCPAGWREKVSATLAEVCEFQWRSAHSSIIGAIQSGDLDHRRISFEDLTLIGEHGKLANQTLATLDWLGIPESSARSMETFADIGPVMSTNNNRNGRWRGRAHEIAPALTGESRMLSEEFGYRLEKV